MFKIIAFLISVVLCQTSSAIWNGTPVLPENALQNHVVALTMYDQVFCTGTLIRPDVVLTAAHCVYGEQASFIRVYFGNFKRSLAPFVGVGNLPVPSRDAPFRNVVNAVVHPRYSPPSQKRIGVGSGDLALLKLSAPAPTPFTPVKMSDSSQILFLSGVLNVLGFGMTQEKDNSATFSELKLTREGIRMAILEPTMFVYSAKENGVCQGDSGGPLFHRYLDSVGNIVTELVGVTSFMRPAFSWIPDTSEILCAESASNYFVNVAKYSTWINQSLR